MDSSEEGSGGCREKRKGEREMTGGRVGKR
jgi:hypothetical protein